jgi:NADH-quinone oxidoreductase subunit E
MSLVAESLISEPVRQEIEHWMKKYPPERKQSALLIALRLVQEQNGGWLSLELLDAVADFLDLPKIAVYEVATFYSMYDLKPVGKHKIDVCNNISCLLNQSEKIIEHLEERLEIRLGETTADGLFTLNEVECLAACIYAPVLQLDDKEYVENLTIEKIDALIERIRALEAGNV